jgi:SCY1-like protein 1
MIGVNGIFHRRIIWQTDWGQTTGAFESAPAPPVVDPKPITASGLGAKLRSSSFDSQQTKDSFNAQDNHFDPWKDEESLSIPSQPTHPAQSRKTAVPTSNTILSRTLSHVSTPISSPPPEADGWDSVERKATTAAVSMPSMAGMSKEEKAAEMARRKEERKIAS